MRRIIAGKLVTPLTVLSLALFAALAATLTWIAVAVRAAIWISSAAKSYKVDIPLPAQVLLAIAYTVVTLLLFRYRRGLCRIRAGLCRRCGYNLRETPNRCPECGYSVRDKVSGVVTH